VGAAWGALCGLAHAHVGWLFIHTQRGAKRRYARGSFGRPDRLFRSDVRGVGGVGTRGRVPGWESRSGIRSRQVSPVSCKGGAVRVLVVHHVTYSVNSLCHFFGRRRFAAGDESRNLLWLAVPSFGEAWHNNHHAFPTSAAHGLGRFEESILRRS
jgi:stearoyl-CoA desaturase (delta-9 desaturase)